MRPELFSNGYFLSPPVTGTVTVPAPAVPEKKSTKAGIKPRGARAERNDGATAVAPLESQPDPTPRITAAGPHVLQAMVTADTLPIFATNSSKSRVVMVLNKGDRVQTDLLIIDSLGHWSFVKVPGQRVSGYVRSEDIDRIRTASNN
jgi:hypothetical protein